MTWEWACILCIFLICATTIVCIVATKLETSVENTVDLSPLQAEIDKIKADHELVAKTAEESKKLLSQANLAVGFTPRGHR